MCNAGFSSQLEFSCPSCGANVTTKVQDYCRETKPVPTVTRVSPETVGKDASVSVPKPTEVLVTCPNGHCGAYRCDNGTARVVDVQDVQYITQLQAVFAPEAGLKRLNDYGTWLFASVAVVGVLATAFSSLALKDVGGPGKVLSALAVLFVAGSLFCASASLTPQWVTISRHSIDSMENAVQQAYESRRSKLWLAALLFAGAIVLAGLVPLSTLVIPTASTEPTMTVEQSLDALGTLKVMPTIAEIPAGTAVTFHLYRADGTTAAELGPSAIAVSDDARKASGEITVQSLSLPATLLVIATTSDSSGSIADRGRTLFTVAAPTKSP